MILKSCGVRRNFLNRAFACLSIVLALTLSIAPYVYAAVGNEEEVVNDFADFLIKILTGPISKILAAVILISGVWALLQGRTNVAVACAFAFLILMFLPKLIESFR